jgi:nuclear pore complex protein Nup155
LEKAGNVQTLLPASSVEHEHSVPLPAFLAQELGSTRLSSLMGLLPEADLAWMSVDEKLFVWSYDSSSSLDPFHQKNRSTEDFCFFPVPSGQCVVSVGLVKPKKGAL